MNKTTTSIDIFDFISEDEGNDQYRKEGYSEMVYIHAQELLEAVQSELENHPKYKDFNVEILGVRWGY